MLSKKYAEPVRNTVLADRIVAYYNREMSKRVA